MSIGCVGAPDTSTVDEESGGGGPGCPPGGCFNSNEVINYGMHEANLFGMPDVQGFTLTTNLPSRRARFLKAGLAYDLYVTHGRFIARRGTTTLQGIHLTGGIITVNKNGAPIYEIVVMGVRTIPFPLGTPSLVEVYDLRWRVAGTTGAPTKNICPGPAAVDPRPDLYGMYAWETLVYEGDRFRPGTMTVDPVPDPNWFNFGCASHTLAKLYLLRQTTESGLNWAERQASLKLMVADFCGHGKTYTVPGTPFRWKGGAVDYWSIPTKLEARWNEYGATCIHDLRVLSTPDYPSVPDAMALDCPTLPACTDLTVTNLGTALRITGLP